MQVSRLQTAIASLQAEANSSRKRVHELEEALGAKTKVCYSSVCLYVCPQEVLANHSTVHVKYCLCLGQCGFRMMV